MNLNLVQDGDAPDGSQGRIWFVTFGDMGGVYDLPPINTDASGLSGFEARAWSYTALEGRGPLGGHFRLKFRKSAWSGVIGHNASAVEMKTALEQLPTIGRVSVTRQGPSAPGGYVRVLNV